MFFVLSKILVFLIYPFTWILIFIFIALLTKNKKLKKYSLISSIVIAIFFSETIIFNFFMKNWEPDAKPISKLEKKYEVAVVLGGIATYDNKAEKMIPRFAADRLIQAVKLYKLGIVKKILISGGAASLFIDLTPEADFLKKYLIAIGIPEKDIIIEDKSKNTHENAVFTYQIFKEKKWLDKKFLLITSAFHMRRAKACFEKVGFKNFDTFPVDHYGGKLQVDYHLILLPKAEVLAYWNILIKEWVGMVMYKIVGYI
jgi:uncharacterized SAM-binding protein YcdF (DUF218 family)